MVAGWWERRGGRLVGLNPMRTEEGAIMQRPERRKILDVAEKAEMMARLRRNEQKLREAEQRLREMNDGPPRSRIAATG